MADFGMNFHHLGLAVTYVDKARQFAAGLGYQLGEVVYDPNQKVNLCLCTNPNLPSIELVFSAGQSSPLDNIISNRTEAIYHICYEVHNLDKTLKSIKDGGNRIICISPPKPAILFENRIVSFYIVKGFGLVEFLEQY